VLNRLAEDGILTPWFLHPQQRFGTTHRLINIVCILQLLTIVASMGDVYTLGEAYAFGVIWSFVFKTLAMVILRFKDKSPRAYEVPLNVRFKQIDLPIGITIIFLILLSTALINLFTKKVATVWGIGFTMGFLAVFVICEQLSHRLRKGAHHAHLEQFNQKITDAPTPEALGLTHPHPVLVAIRNPKSMRVLGGLLHEIDTTRQDIVAITCKVLPPLTPGITPQEMMVDDNDREVLTRVVNLAEEAGKQVYPLVIPTNNPLYAIATAARDLQASQVILGSSEKSSTDVQLEQFAMAWGMAIADAPASPALTIRIAGEKETLTYEL
jgi:nucleotide-binding universal stress UspA family protein